MCLKKSKKKKKKLTAALLFCINTGQRVSLTGQPQFSGSAASRRVEEEARFDVLDGDGIIFLSPILSAAIISPSQRDDAC